MKPVGTSDYISISCWWFLLVRWSWMYSKITALLFIGAGGQNNTLVSACRHVCLHTCMLLSHDCKWLHENNIQLAWMLPSNNTHTRTDTHNVPILKCDTSDDFYLWLLLLILERIFPLRSQLVAVVVEVVNDGYLHVLRLHLSFFIRLASPSPRVTHTGCYSTAPGGAPAPEDDMKLCPSSSCWCCFCRRFAPLVCLIRCPYAPQEGGVKESR